ncbi:uncharacterized protein [Dermacentor albipictus]|uniref:uncharacterized protein isoform X2 n=1 Tax=Dermacentor albipictus TaxID=60249 RepID=UPI0031FD8E73
MGNLLNPTVAHDGVEMGDDKLLSSGADELPASSVLIPRQRPSLASPLGLTSSSPIPTGPGELRHPGATLVMQSSSLLGEATKPRHVKRPRILRNQRSLGPTASWSSSSRRHRYPQPQETPQKAEASCRRLKSSLCVVVSPSKQNAASKLAAVMTGNWGTRSSPFTSAAQHLASTSSLNEQRIPLSTESATSALAEPRALEEGRAGEPAAGACADSSSTGRGFRRVSVFTRSLLLVGATASLLGTLVTVATWNLLQGQAELDVAYNISSLLRLLAPSASGAESGNFVNRNASWLASTNSSVADHFTTAKTMAPVKDNLVPLF